jgi:hypothetical protein
MSEEGKFKLLQRTKLEDLNDGTVKELPESDLCIQTETHIVQFEYAEEEQDKEKFTIKPGIWTLVNTSVGLRTKKFELKTHDLLESASNTQLIKKESKLFFDKLDIYKKYNKDPKRSILLYSQPGMGKCLGPNQGVLMYDGSVKKAKNVKVGDLLMGPDSKPRKVLMLHSGKDEMYRVVNTKGDCYTVNSNHVISLKNTDTKEIVNISVKEYLKKSESFKIRNKGYKTKAVDFKHNHKELIVDPYILGLWLGDGSSHSISLTTMDDELAKKWSDYGEKFGLKTNKWTKPLNKASTYNLSSGKKHGKKDRNILLNFFQELGVINNKKIPQEYKTSSQENRLKILAGLIDSDGYLTSNTYEIVQKNETLANDIVFVARSLGLACTVTDKKIDESTYKRVRIFGDIDKIPVLLKRKKAEPRKQIKDALVNAIKIEPIGFGDYNGFTVDSDNLFVLDNFVVTHNSSTIAKISQEFTEEDKGTVVLFWDTSDIRSSTVSKFLSTGSKFSKDCTRMLFVMEDIGGGNTEGYHGPKGADASLLELLDGASVSFRLPTFIIATTNTPENLLKSLADRPGRFDQMFELEGPNAEERFKLGTYIAKRELSGDEAMALKSKDADGLSIAHISEIVIRAELHDKTFAEVITEMKEHKARIERAFEKAKKKQVGLMG